MSIGAILGYGAAAGVISTLMMDLSNLLWVPMGIRGPTPELFCKWFDALRAGRFVSENLMAAPPPVTPMPVGVIVHYGIGIALATAFVALLANVDALLQRPMLTGIAFGIATCVFAWFLMFPSMGFGFLGLRPPEGVALFTGSLLRHLAYGVGLGLCAHLWSASRITTG